MKRFLAALLSTILFATIFSWVSYVPSSQQEPNVYYFGFFEISVFVIIYTAPVYFLVGLPISILIDKLVVNVARDSKWTLYFIQLGLYSLAGVLVGFLYLLVFSGSIYLEGFISFSIYAIVASNLYFHMFLLVQKLSRKLYN